MIITGTPFKDNKQDSSALAHQYQGGKGVTRHHTPMHMTPLEISMYVLLAAFCFAIVVSSNKQYICKTKDSLSVFSGVCGVLCGVRFQIQTGWSSHRRNAGGTRESQQFGHNSWTP